MKLKKLSALGAFFTTAGMFVSSSAFAAATASGDKFDGIVEVQDTFQGIIDNGGGFAVILLSVIVAVALFAVTRQWAALIVPLGLGIFLGVAVDMATALGGVSAETDLYTTSELTLETPKAGMPV